MKYKKCSSCGKNTINDTNLCYRCERIYYNDYR